MVKTRKLSRPDARLFFTILTILFLGVVIVYDASVVRAENIFGGKYYFLILQSIWAFFGLLFLWLALNLNYSFLLWLARKLIFVSLFFLILTALPRFLPGGIGAAVEIFVPKVKSSHRWIYLNYKPLPPLPLFGRVGFQPSELAKISLVLYLAGLISNKNKKSVFLKLILATGVLSGLVLLQPDFGTALIISLIGLTIFLASGVSLKKAALVFLPFIFLSFFFVWSSPYRRERFLSYLSRPSQAEGLSTRYQINQVLISLGSGGIWGVGLGQSRQKYDYVPEVNTDSVFAIVGEETGLVGTTFLLLVFCFLIYRSLSISVEIDDRFGFLTAVGICSFLGLQTLINLSGMTHLLPLTGVPLPLVSYGGSSLLSNMFSLGILLNVSRLRKEK